MHYPTQPAIGSRRKMKSPVNRSTFPPLICYFHKLDHTKSMPGRVSITMVMSYPVGTVPYDRARINRDCPPIWPRPPDAENQIIFHSYKSCVISANVYDKYNLPSTKSGYFYPLCSCYRLYIILFFAQQCEIKNISTDPTDYFFLPCNQLCLQQRNKKLVRFYKIPLPSSLLV